MKSRAANGARQRRAIFFARWGAAALIAAVPIAGRAGTERRAAPIATAQKPSAPGDLQGASAILQTAATVAAAAKPQAIAGVKKAAVTNPAVTLKAAIDDLSAKAASLPPEESARQWLGLADRYFALLDQGGANQFQTADGLTINLRFSNVLDALPPPTAWPALTAAVQARPIPSLPAGSAPIALGVVARRFRGLLLRSIVDTLNHRPDAEWNDFDSLKATLQTALTRRKKGAAAQSNDQIAAVLNYSAYDTLLNALLKTAPAPQRIAAAVAFQIDLHKAAATLGNEMRGNQEDSLSLPDLVTLVGPTAAETLLRRALALPRTIVSIEHGEATRQLACRIIVANPSLLRVPQWGMVTGFDPDSQKLFVTLRGRFGLSSSDHNNDSYNVNGPRSEAIGFYLYGTCLAGHTADAVALALKLPPAENNYASPLTGVAFRNITDDRGAWAVAYEFLAAVSAKDANVDVLDALLKIAPHLGRGADTLALIRKAAARPDLTPVQRDALQTSLVDALLGANRLDEAIALLRSQLADAQHQATTDAAHPDKREADWLRMMSPAEKIADLGVVLNRDDWFDEATGVIIDVVQARATAFFAAEPITPQTNSNLSWDSTIFSAAKRLRKKSRFADAERLLSLGLRMSIVQEARDEAQGAANGNTDSAVNRYQTLVNHDSGSTPSSAQYLAALAVLYDAAGRPSDVVALLDRAPYWGVADLAEVNTESSEGEEHALVMAAVRALLATGRGDDARRMTLALIPAYPGYDPFYALLLQIDGPEASLPTLDALAARDRFEERPLIWRAEALLELNRPGEAETAARAAIAIDPSDGEEPHGDRMRAYAVLSKIRAARGDAKEAEQYASVVTAIRTAEQADDLYAAGLTDRAIHLYEEALTHFADAYCIQSRLAVQLNQEGKFAEAAAHYRRAYELMPESFGRMESHCFGCEGAFSGVSAQHIAEQVFQNLALTEPKKPQVRYLLGYLREEQGRATEAEADFREAARLDPDYVNAWKHISGLSEQVSIPAADRDAAAINLLRLDPRQRHIIPDVSAVSDLAALYDQVARLQSEKSLPSKTGMRSWRWQTSVYEPPATLYPLAGAQLALKTLHEAALAELSAQGNADPEQALRSMISNQGMDSEENRVIRTPAGAVAENAVLSAAGNWIDSSTLSADGSENRSEYRIITR